MQRFSSTAERAGSPRTAWTSAISSRTGDLAIPAWSSSCGVSMITTSSSWAISGTLRCSSRDGRATMRNGKAGCPGASRGAMAARSDHSRALPDGSAPTSSTRFPACAKTCASQTADVVLPVPGFRLARAMLSPVIKVLSQRRPRSGSRSSPIGRRGQYYRNYCIKRDDGARAAPAGRDGGPAARHPRPFGIIGSFCRTGGGASPRPGGSLLVVGGGQPGPDLGRRRVDERGAVRQHHGGHGLVAPVDRHDELGGGRVALDVDLGDLDPGPGKLALQGAAEAAP